MSPLMKQENEVQKETIEQLTHDDQLVVWVIEHWGGVWRDIINDFEKQCHRTPTPDELLVSTATILHQHPLHAIQQAYQHIHQ